MRKLTRVLGFFLFSVSIITVGCKGGEGPVGPGGAQGESGSAGPTGSMGLPGLANLEMLSQVSAFNSSSKLAQVSCPQGKLATGGGAFVSLGNITVTFSQPLVSSGTPVGLRDPLGRADQIRQDHAKLVRPASGQDRDRRRVGV